jgi:hypothetical protein
MGVPANREWTLEALQALSRDDALAVFATLPPPSQMTGEFSGHIPAYSEPDWRAFLAEAKIGHWLGKGYVHAPDGVWQGHGYNVYQTEKRMVRRLRFAWSFGTSSLDGAPALIMRYGAFDNWAGQQDLTDEIRRAGPGVMLGIYFTKDVVPGFTPRRGDGGGRTGPEIFILRGPIGPAKPADRD